MQIVERNLPLILKSIWASDCDDKGRILSQFALYNFMSSLITISLHSSLVGLLQVNDEASLLSKEVFEVGLWGVKDGYLKLLTIMLCVFLVLFGVFK